MYKTIRHTTTARPAQLNRLAVRIHTLPEFCKLMSFIGKTYDPSWEMYRFTSEVIVWDGLKSGFTFNMGLFPAVNLSTWKALRNLEEKSPNQKLVDFMRLKSDLLNAPYFFTTEDADDLLSWPDVDAQRVVDNLKFTSDPYCCPWCIFHGPNSLQACRSCTYGKRHGICNEVGEENTYVKVCGQQEEYDSLVEALHADKGKLFKALGRNNDRD